MHRFIVEDQPLEGVITLPESERDHALKVLRLRAGDQVELIDGKGGIASAVIESADKRAVTARVTALLPPRESNLSLSVYIGLPKGEKLELIVQKLTELGVSAMTPVIMERSVARGEASDHRMTRLERIAREAVKQCGRGALPVLYPPQPWDGIMPRLEKHALCLVPWEKARGARLIDVYEKTPSARDIALIIGPEGGMSPEEVARIPRGAPVTLGPRILRAETAAIAASAAVMALWGDL